MDIATPSAKPERKGAPLSAKRMMALVTSTKMIGDQEAHAAEIGISARTLRLKISAGSGVSNAELIGTADALDRRAAQITAHANKIRALVASENARPSNQGEGHE